MRSAIPLRLRAVSVAVMVTLGATAGGQTLQLFGTWKLNTSKSTLAGAPPKAQTVTFQPSGADGVLGTEETVYADDTHTQIQYAAKTDGLDYPLTGSLEILARADRISMKRINATTILWSYKKGSTPVLSLPGSLSADGQTLTMVASGSNVVLIYERQ